MTSVSARMDPEVVAVVSYLESAVQALALDRAGCLRGMQIWATWLAGYIFRHRLGGGPFGEGGEGGLLFATTIDRVWANIPESYLGEVSADGTLPKAKLVLPSEAVERLRDNGTELLHVLGTVRAASRRPPSVPAAAAAAAARYVPSDDGASSSESESEKPRPPKAHSVSGSEKSSSQDESENEEPSKGQQTRLVFCRRFFMP